MFKGRKGSVPVKTSDSEEERLWYNSMVTSACQISPSSSFSGWNSSATAEANVQYSPKFKTPESRKPLCFVSFCCLPNPMANISEFLIKQMLHPRRTADHFDERFRWLWNVWILATLYPKFEFSMERSPPKFICLWCEHCSYECSYECLIQTKFIAIYLPY